VITWVNLESSGRRFTLYNTHLGIVPWNWARTGTELLTLLDRDWSGEPQILVGDFNTLRRGPLFRRLIRTQENGTPVVLDAWLEARKRERGPGSFHWGYGLPWPRVDYILLRPRCEVSRAAIVGERIGGIFPSDHYAVVADLDVCHGDGLLVVGGAESHSPGDGFSLRNPRAVPPTAGHTVPTGPPRHGFGPRQP